MTSTSRKRRRERLFSRADGVPTRASHDGAGAARVSRGALFVKAVALCAHAVVLLGCGAHAGTAGSPAARTAGEGGAEVASVGSREASDASAASVRLALVSFEGDAFDVADYRGQRTLVFIFATFDGVSQAALRPLARFLDQHPGLKSLGIAVQPDAEALLPSYVSALNPPFFAAYDPSESVVHGRSAFGPVAHVPTYILLSEAGVELVRTEGLLKPSELEAQLGPYLR